MIHPFSSARFSSSCRRVRGRRVKAHSKGWLSESVLRALVRVEGEGEDGMMM